jgi:NAD-dependent SIR2 family protein deacetylase
MSVKPSRRLLKTILSKPDGRWLILTGAGISTGKSGTHGKPMQQPIVYLAPPPLACRYPLLTVHVDSGIPDYRGPDGTYTRHPTYRPVTFQQFMASKDAHFRNRHALDAALMILTDYQLCRYWARSFLGWPRLRHAQPNPGHQALVRWHEWSRSRHPRSSVSVVTQNVDSLHRQAGHPAVLELRTYTLQYSVYTVYMLLEYG